MKTNQAIALGVAAAIAGSMQGASAASPPIAYAELSAYPGKTGLTASGKVYVTNDGGAMRVFTQDIDRPYLSYSTDPAVVECTACGVHIHVGVSCDDESGPGGHYYTEEPDTWLDTTYSTDSNQALLDVTATDAVFTNLESVIGRVVVLHGAKNVGDGDNRIACGVIKGLGVSWEDTTNAAKLEDVVVSHFIGAELKPYIYDTTGDPITQVAVIKDTQHSVTWNVRAAGTTMMFTDGAVSDTNTVDSPLLASFYFLKEGLDDTCETLNAEATFPTDNKFNTLAFQIDLKTTSPNAEYVTVNGDGNAYMPTVVHMKTSQSGSTVSSSCVDMLEIAMITGHVTISGDENNLMVSGFADNLPFVSGSGGWHVHTGITCYDEYLVGGHLENAAGEDPWAGKEYTVDDKKRTTFTDTVAEPVSFTSARTVVLHGPGGVRIACGVLDELRPDHGVASLSVYPTGDTGTVTDVVGGLVVSYNTKLGLLISGQVAGLEADCVECGFHIHEGYTCATSGGHYWYSSDIDPWKLTKYTTDANGIALIHVTVPAIEFASFAEVAGRTIVFHGADSRRVACGKIMPLGKSLFVTSEMGPYADSDADAAVAQFNNDDVKGTVTVQKLTDTSVNVVLSLTELTAGVDHTVTIVNNNTCGDAAYIGDALFEAALAADVLSATETLDEAFMAEDGSVSFANLAVYIVSDDGDMSCSNLAYKNNVEGFMIAHESADMLKMTLTARNLQDIGPQITAGGWHVHEGSSCDASGGHLLDDGPDGSNDPWLEEEYKYEVKMATSANPTLAGRTIVEFEGYVASTEGQLGFIRDHTVVMHSQVSAQRMACGEIRNAMVATPSPTTAAPSTAEDGTTEAPTKPPTNAASNLSVSLVVVAASMTIACVSSYF